VSSVVHGLARGGVKPPGLWCGTHGDGRLGGGTGREDCANPGEAGAGGGPCGGGVADGKAWPGSGGEWPAEWLPAMLYGTSGEERPAGRRGPGGCGLTGTFRLEEGGGRSLGKAAGGAPGWQPRLTAMPGVKVLGGRRTTTGSDMDGGMARGTGAGVGEPSRSSILLPVMDRPGFSVLEGKTGPPRPPTGAVVMELRLPLPLPLPLPPPWALLPGGRAWARSRGCR